MSESYRWMSESYKDEIIYMVGLFLAANVYRISDDQRVITSKEHKVTEVFDKRISCPYAP
jgi:hypothetical protein